MGVVMTIEKVDVVTSVKFVLQLLNVNLRKYCVYSVPETNPKMSEIPKFIGENIHIINRKIM